MSRSCGSRFTKDAERRTMARNRRLADVNRNAPPPAVRLMVGPHAGKTLEEIAEAEGGMAYLERYASCGERSGERRAVRNFVVRRRHEAEDRNVVVDPTLVPPWEGPSQWEGQP